MKIKIILLLLLFTKCKLINSMDSLIDDLINNDEKRYQGYNPLKVDTDINIHDSEKYDKIKTMASKSIIVLGSSALLISMRKNLSLSKYKNIFNLDRISSSNEFIKRLKLDKPTEANQKKVEELLPACNILKIKLEGENQKILDLENKIFIECQKFKHLNSTELATKIVRLNLELEGLSTEEKMKALLNFSSKNLCPVIEQQIDTQAKTIGKINSQIKKAKQETLNLSEKIKTTEIIISDLNISQFDFWKKRFRSKKQNLKDKFFESKLIVGATLGITYIITKINEKLDSKTKD